ncbi:MAG TPA: Ig-like domain-containing protein [Kofleriaceae bacterium]|nr:Ig-like domain-containing protein [Kofleriaceae bacterium]
MTQNQIDVDGNPLTESALRCKYVDGKKDPKAPGFVGDPITGGSVVCPDNESDFTPATVDPRLVDGQPWAVRIMFDELLDGDRVETLDCDSEGVCQGTLSETRPVTLKCGDTSIRYYENPSDDPDTQAIDRYRSFYVPNGNNVTFPLGPSIYVQPKPEELVFPTGSMCSITIDPTKVVDKDGNPPPDGDLVTNFQIAPLTLLAIDPADAATPATISPDPNTAGAAAFVFNATLDEKSVDPEAFTIDGPEGPVPTAVFVDGYNVDGDAIYVLPDTDTGIFQPGMYTVTMAPTQLAEVNGGTLDVTEQQVTHFQVAFAKIGQTSGTNFPANGQIVISFNNAIDPSTLDTTLGGADLEFFQTAPATTPPNMPIPAMVMVGNSPAGSGLDNVPGNAIIITPTAPLGVGTYVVRFKAGAEIKDVGDAHTAHFTTPLALTYKVTAAGRTATAARAARIAPASSTTTTAF